MHQEQVRLNAGNGEQSSDSSLFTSHVVPTQSQSYLLSSRDLKSRYHYGKNSNGNAHNVGQVEWSGAKWSQWKRGISRPDLLGQLVSGLLVQGLCKPLPFCGGAS
ncbi:hypothetical protein CRENBAI_012734 [Crenichthys baileyi]|uniref:Uncharacterized protein n=1 Tax=Crenichthys baileyi TaxID=28760 RepID=A0AAV9QXG3_9TELE